MEPLSWLLLALAAGSGVYCVLVVAAARSYLATRREPAEGTIPLSVLKPLHGLDEGLEQNLRSIFEQDYAHYELLFAVRHDTDPAVALLRRLMDEYPSRTAQLLLVGEPPYANAKVWSLEQMTAAARHDVLVMSDSDIWVDRTFLATIASEFSDAELGVATCLYRAVPGDSMPSTFEAIGMNTEFLSGVLVARIVEGVKFALGPTLVARKQAIADVGGWRYLSEFLAEDFVLGNVAAEKGWRVVLSRHIVEHHIGSQGWRSNARHRLRWYRSTRRSRPAGYIGQLFTNPLPLVLLMLAVRPALWPAALVVTALRAFAAWATAVWVLQDPLIARRWYLVPLQDLLSFGFWLAGFFGNRIEWRGHRYELLADGRFRRLH